MRRRLGSIEWKFPALITAVVVVAVVAFLWTGHARLSGVVTEASGTRLLLSARLVADMLGDGNGATRARLANAAAAPEFVALLRGGRGEAAAAVRLGATTPGDSSLVGRWLLDPDGEVRLASAGAPARALWSATEVASGRVGSARLGVSPVFEHQGLPLFELVVAVPGAAGSAPRPLGYLVEARLARGRGVEAVQGLAGTRTLLLGDPEAGVWTDLARVAPGPPRIQRTDSIVAFTDSPRGAGVGALSPVAGTPWVVWLQLSHAEVMVPVRQWLNRVVPLGVLVVLAAALMAWLASRGITGRLAALTHRMDALELGTSDATPKAIGAPDEIGRLEGAFQHLLERARSHKRLEVQLQESQKLEAVGRLAGGIAHDFNNMLTVVSNYGEMVRAELPQGSSVERDMDEVLRAAERAARLTRQLLTFSGRRVVAPQLLDLNAVIRDSQGMLERLIPENVKFLWDLDPHIGSIRADYGQMEQVLLNLVLNAADAMPDGGELTIRTTHAELDVPPLVEGAAGDPTLRDKPHVCLAVRDTGLGMDRETAARVFEPFFTTKTRGKGTGLGLATVHGIVSQLGGRIWLYSEPREGSTFKLYFPEEQGAAEALPVRAPTELPAQATGRILLVEDDVALREVTRRLLARSGFEVLVAADAAAALPIVAREGERLSLVLSDVVMPGLSGAELAAQLARTHPRLPIILMSGYNDLPPGTWEASGTVRGLLEKPFTITALHSAVVAALEGGPATASPPGSGPPRAGPR